MQLLDIAPEAEKFDAMFQPELACDRLQGPALRPVAHEQQPRLPVPGRMKRPNHHRVVLDFGKPADADEHDPAAPRRASAPERYDPYTVVDGRQPIGIDADLVANVFLDGVGYRHHSCESRGRTPLEPVSHCPLRPGEPARCVSHVGTMHRVDHDRRAGKKSGQRPFEEHTPFVRVQNFDTGRRQDAREPERQAIVVALALVEAEHANAGIDAARKVPEALEAADRDLVASDHLIRKIDDDLLGAAEFQRLDQLENAHALTIRQSRRRPKSDGLRVRAPFRPSPKRSRNAGDSPAGRGTGPRARSTARRNLPRTACPWSLPPRRGYGP